MSNFKPNDETGIEGYWKRKAYRLFQNYINRGQIVDSVNYPTYFSSGTSVFPGFDIEYSRCVGEKSWTSQSSSKYWTIFDSPQDCQTFYSLVNDRRITDASWIPRTPLNKSYDKNSKNSSNNYKNFKMCTKQLIPSNNIKLECTQQNGEIYSEYVSSTFIDYLTRHNVPIETKKD